METKREIKTEVTLKTRTKLQGEDLRNMSFWAQVRNEKPWKLAMHGFIIFLFIAVIIMSGIEVAQQYFGADISGFAPAVSDPLTTGGAGSFRDTLAPKYEGFFIIKNKSLYQLISAEGDPFTSAPPTVLHGASAEFDSLIIASPSLFFLHGVGDYSQYNLIRMNPNNPSRETKVDLSYTYAKSPDNKLQLLYMAPRTSVWQPGEYRLEVPRIGMDGGLSFSYIVVEDR